MLLLKRVVREESPLMTIPLTKNPKREAKVESLMMLTPMLLLKKVERDKRVAMMPTLMTKNPRREEKVARAKKEEMTPTMLLPKRVAKDLKTMMPTPMTKSPKVAKAKRVVMMTTLKDLKKVARAAVKVAKAPKEVMMMTQPTTTLTQNPERVEKARRAAKVESLDG